MYADTYDCTELKTQCEYFLADNIVRSRQKVMLSAAYGDLFFLLPVEAMLAIQALLPANAYLIWPEETDVNEEIRTERSRSEGESLQSDYVPSPPLRAASTQAESSSAAAVPVEKKGENEEHFPVLGTVETQKKPRAYSDMQGIDIRELQRNSPFPVKVQSEKKRRRQPAKVAKAPVWGAVHQSSAVPLTHIQAEQRDRGQFFNPWGLEKTTCSHNFRDIQEEEQTEEELEIALQVIADMEQAEKLAR